MKILEEFDAFSAPYNLNLRGSDSFRTRLGGTCSLGIYILVLAFMIQRMLYMVNRNEPRMYQIEQSVDLVEDLTPYSFKESNFTVGMFVSRTSFDPKTMSSVTEYIDPRELFLVKAQTVETRALNEPQVYT
jgi:hypothetical protein